MNWELMDLLGRLIICLGIVSSIIMFATVNANYLPKDEGETEKDPEGNKK